jgi:tetratricopeptide (TPR) repeat protein
MEAVIAKADSMNRNYIPMTGDSLLREACRYYDRHGTPNERMRAHYLLGRTYYDCGKLPDALGAFHTAAACADTTHSDCDYHTLSLAHTQMADIFHRHYQPRTAIEELKEAQRMAYKDCDTLMAIECYFDQANEYERLGETDTAFAIAREAARLFAVLGQHDRAAAAKSSTTLMLLEQHRTEEARAAIDAYLASAYTDSLGHVSPGREIFYYKRGLYYLQTNKTDSAEYFFRKELREGLDINNQIAGRKGLQLLYEKQGKADSVAKYAAEGYRMSDSVYMVSESQNVQSMQAMSDYTHKQLMIEQETRELKETRLYMVIAIASLLLIIFAIVFIAQKRDKRHAITAAGYQSTIRELSLEDRLSRSPIVTQLQDMANGNPPLIASPTDIKALKALICDNIPSFFDTVSPSPSPLSHQEYLVCLLTRLAFPSVSIDRLTGVSEGYTSRLKSRIFKKVTGKDGSAKDFEHWIMSIK